VSGRRYEFLTDKEFIEAWNRLKDAFLAAKDGDDVDLIVKGLLSNDERLKIGRRIEVARMLAEGLPNRDIAQRLRVGVATVQMVSERMSRFPECFKILEERTEKVEKEFKKRAYVKTGGAKLLFKKTRYTGYKRKDVKR
jgi:TrpR family transcriptional regulator, trp operon repressor